MDSTKSKVEIDALADDATLVLDGIKQKDLEAYIEAQLQELDFAKLCSDTCKSLQAQVRAEEKKAREVNKIISDMQEQFTQLKDILQSDDRAAKKSAIEKIESVSDIEIGDADEDEDDDVQFIEATFIPPIKRFPPKPNPGIRQPQLVPAPQNTYGPGRPAGLMVTSTGRFTNTPLLQDMKPVVVQQQKTTPVPQLAPKQIDLAIGMKLYGKKGSDLWYKGTLVDIQKQGSNKSQWQYKIKFDGKGVKMLAGKQIAFTEPPNEILPVGSRVIALYRDEETNSAGSFYAGVVAEPPSIRNQNRYLIFFDDGYAQYSPGKEINKVYEQSKNVWEDIPEDSKSFIQSYIEQYPERPMVRLQKGQVVKTEWQGEWWQARVEVVDSSLVKMFFEADKRIEWIYRGSTRLEPLYTELANAEMVKAGKQRRHKANVKSAKKPIIEYTRGFEDKQAGGKENSENSEGPKRRVARKSTARQHSNSSNSAAGEIRERLLWDFGRSDTSVDVKSNKFQASSFSSKQTGMDIASVLEKRLAGDSGGLDEDSLGQRVDIKGFRDVIRKKFSSKKVADKPGQSGEYPHRCSYKCLVGHEDNPSKYKGHNPLLIPMLCGWERQIAKQKQACRKVVFYRAPCARRLRCIEEVDDYLRMTDSNLTIDLFSFETTLHTHTEFVPIKTYCDIKDLSYGKENVPISCVNGIDRQYPDYVEYSNQRIPGQGVKLNLDEEFLCGCSCTDGCRDPKKCECIQMSLEASKCSYGGKGNPDATYSFRRLKEQVLTGIYECNVKCKCDSRCNNRVAQNGLQLRLQVFKTENRGWGLRCLDDIPAGGFICIYAGQMLTEQTANEDGKQYGDEYFAELDYIEVVERAKEGYESNADIDEGIDSDEFSDDSDSFDPAADTDSNYSGDKTNQKGKKRNDNKDSKVGKIVLKRDSTSKEKEWSCKLVNSSPQKPVDKAAEWLKQVPGEHGNGDAIVISDDDESPPEEKPKPVLAKQASDELPDLDSSPKPAKDAKEDATAEDTPSLRITEATSLSVEGIKEDDDEDSNANAHSKRTTRSQTMRFSNLPDPAKNSQEEEKKKANKANEKDEEFESSRKYFGERFCYIMDAKATGNLGRYLNHSCTPNCFVQNIFVDTHDLRFPWVAFFAARYIRAGTELTWDYNYEVGSVKGKVLYCYCGSAECRGRLL